MKRDLDTALATGQGLYYLVTGVWPLVSMRSFEAVTGPKTDRWLVKTVGVLVGVVGSVLMLSGRRARVPLEPTVLATGSAAGLAAIDAIYASRGRISKVYLLDALAEIVLIGAWALGKRKSFMRGATRRRGITRVLHTLRRVA